MKKKEKNIMKKIISFTVALALTVSMIQVQAEAGDEQQTAVWGSYFGWNEGWLEAPEGSVVSQNDRGWTAKMDPIGYGGCWGGYVYQDKEQGYGTLDIQKGKEYTISFDLVSTDCDKWVFLTVGAAMNSEQGAFSDWIKLKKGEKYSYSKNFTAQNNAQGVAFGIGGDLGNSGLWDSAYRYGLTDEKTFDEDPTASTTIECSNFSIIKKDEVETTTKYVADTKETSKTTDKITSKTNEDVPNADKPNVKKVSGMKVRQKKNRKVKISWKKIKEVKGYQISYGLNNKSNKTVVVNVKAKNNCKYTKKLKKGKVYYIKVRAYVIYKGAKVYGSWSNIKKIKIK